MGPELGRTEHEHFRVDFHLQHPQPHPYLFSPTHSLNMHEAIQIEIEKERIRQEIILSEIMKRRTEAEVSRELMMMEGEFDLQRSSNGFPFGSSPMMGFNLPHLGTTADSRSLEERIMSNRSHEDGEVETSPFQSWNADLRISEVEPVPVNEGAKENDKIILLAKPDENISGLEKKAVTPEQGEDVNEFPSDNVLKEKAKVEWSCHLCQVRVNNECVLNEHLQGKKHKAKEAALANMAGKNCRILLECSKKQGGEAASSSSDDLQDNLPDNLKKNEGVEVQKVQKNGDLDKKKYAIWCEMCRVGVSSGKVMNAHKNGKEQINQNEDGEIETSPFQSGTADLRILEVKLVPVKEGARETDKIILRVKPDENISGLEKMTVTPELVWDSNEFPLDGVFKKKAVVKWSCYLFQVYFNIEHALNQHLQGKRHKAKEAALSITAGKNWRIPLECSKMQGGEAASSKSDDLQDNIPGKLKKNRRVKVHKVQKNGDLNKKKHAIWCEMCQVGVCSEKVMNSHKNGKKQMNRNEDGEVETSIFRSGTTDLRISEVKPVPVKEGAKENDKIILLAKPNEDISGSEKKVETPEPRGDINDFPPDSILQKKAKVEWSCHLCQVHVNNECVLNEHLRGKKHKDKQAALANTAGKNCRILLECSNRQGGKMTSSKSDNLHDNHEEVQKVQKNRDLNIKKHTIWCEMCQIEVTSVKDMNAHRKGKKHAMRLEQINRNEDGEVETSPFRSGTVDLRILEVRPVPVKEGAMVNDKIILLAKPNEDISGSEKKVVTPEARGDINEIPPDSILQKKAKVEWRCQLCQVHVNNECVLNEHLRGKKHKEKQAALANAAGKNCRILLECLSGQGGKVTSSKSDNLHDNLKKNKHEEVQKVQKNRDLNIKKHTIWCEMCQIEVTSVKDMKAHKKGRKHAMRLEQINRNEDGEVETSPFRSGTVDLRISEVRPVPVKEGAMVNDKIILPAKPNEDISGSEKKVVTPEARGDINEIPPDSILQKKAKVEWRCQLCQVHVNNECVLNEHLRGKKHKEKQAALANAAGKNCRILLECSNRQGGKVTSSKSDNLHDNLKKNKHEEVQKVQKNRDLNIKKHTIWCEMCQIEVTSVKDMKAHKKGRKHAMRLEQINRNEDGEVETSPFRSGTVDLRISEVRPVPVKEGAMVNDKIILPSELDENISGSEKKAVTPEPGGDLNEFPSDSVLKRKAKVGWSCHLCQVHVNNECVLNEHLQGKMHKANEAALANTAGKNCRILLKCSKMQGGEVASSKSDDLHDNLPDNLKKNERVEVQKVQKNGDLNKKKHAIWCDVCQVQVSSEKVMNAHKNGEKHIRRLQQINRNGGAAPSHQKSIEPGGR